MDLRFVVVKVKDLKRAKKFYRKLIDDEPVKEDTAEWSSLSLME